MNAIYRIRNAIGAKTYERSILIIGLFTAVAMSYGFALLDEPRSVWLWRDILGML